MVNQVGWRTLARPQRLAVAKVAPRMPCMRQLPALAQPPCPALQFEGSRDIPAYGGIPVLEYYDLGHVNKWAWLGWEALFFAAFLAAAWAALSLVRHQRR